MTIRRGGGKGWSSSYLAGKIEILFCVCEKGEVTSSTSLKNRGGKGESFHLTRRRGKRGTLAFLHTLR